MDGAKFYCLETEHKGWLAVRQKDGALCHVRLDEMTARSKEGVPLYIPLLGVKLMHFPDYIFLTAAPDQDKSFPPLWMEKLPFKGSVLPFKCVSIKNRVNCIGLESLFTAGRFCTTQPWGHEGVNYLLGDCVHIMGWETFHLYPISVDGDVFQLGEEIAQSFFYFPSVEHLIKIITEYDGCYFQHVMDSLLPFVAWSVMEELGNEFFSNKNLQDSLLNKIHSPLWKDSLKALLSWMSNKDSSQENYYACIEENVSLTLGDISAPTGFIHTLLSVIRSLVQPRKHVCMLSTIRNEGIYLLEWIAYHRSIGVEHFFIYSNDNNDQSDILLKSLHDEGIITFIDNPVKPGQSAQLKAYAHALNVLPDILDYEWCFIMDGDEFITLSPECIGIGEYLREFSRWHADGIAFNWKFVASSVNVRGMADLVRPLTQRNHELVSHGAIGEGWRLVKSAVRPHKAIQSRPHHPVWLQRTGFTYRQSNGMLHEFRNPPPGIGRDPAFADYGYYDKAYISHYYFKSIIEWVWKYARNSGLDGASSFGIERYADYWANSFLCQLNDQHEGQNEWIIHRDMYTMKALSELRSIPSLREAENVVRVAWQERLTALLKQIDEENVVSRLREDWRFIMDPLSVERQGEIPLLS